MGAAAWWEPVVAVALTLGAVLALLALGGRVYTGAILHSGPTLKLREAWRGTPSAGPAHRSQERPWVPRRGGRHR